MLRVLALDGGDKVGWARADIAAVNDWQNFRHGITPLRDMAVAIYSHTVARVTHALEWPSDYDVIVLEDFRLYPAAAKMMIGSSFPTAQFNGMVKLCCWLSGTKLVTQGAAIQGENGPARKTMKHLRPDLYEMVTTPRAHDDAHDMSALLHLWYWAWCQFVAKPQR